MADAVIEAKQGEEVVAPVEVAEEVEAVDAE